LLADRQIRVGQRDERVGALRFPTLSYWPNLHFSTGC
jgi:hypothetical protein